ncbi:UNVERIFIED_CONTAM: hypothetical protein GTU68_055270 [Idotea baltica]|nr:hypothetical protein [Idotea baltica]
MSTVAEKPAVQEKEPLFDKKKRKLITDPLDDNNPITVQVLGICSALAVTTQVAPALVLTICVIFVLAFANLTVSLMRNIMPGRIRMIIQLIVIATLVTVVDQVLKAFAFELSQQLSVFIGLIITNCIVMGRLEAFAMGNKPWASFLDGIGNGLGYGAILLIVAAIRELFGSGTLMGFKLLTEDSLVGGFLFDMGYQHNGIMLTSSAAMFIIGALIWIQRSRKPALVDIS